MQSWLQYRRIGRETQNAWSQERTPSATPAQTASSHFTNDLNTRTDVEKTLNATSAPTDDHNGANQEDATTNALSIPQSDDKPIIVEAEPTNDLYSPQNWSNSYKWLVTSMVGSTAFVCSGAAAIDAEITRQAMRDFDINQETALLATALFMIALGLGSMISAPFSETVGRNPVYLISLTIFGLFIMGAGLATDAATWLICRFFAGLFASPPLTNFGGSTADMWSPSDRSYVFPILACPTFLGPFLAPMVASFIGASTLVSWQWTEWLTLILTGTIFIGILLFVPETYAPVLLSWKAQHLRRVSGDLRYRSRHELHQIPLWKRLARSMIVPIKFLVTEPIVDCFSLYLIIIYLILFGFLPGFEFIFGRDGIYGFTQPHTGLCFIGMNVGFLVALIPIWPIYKRYKRKVEEAKEQGKDKVVPEERLWYSIIGAPLLPVSIFWMAWTSWPDVSFFSPLVASGLFGFSVVMIFLSCYQYLIDSYETLAASALVGSSVSRYIIAGPMVIVSVPMYENLGPHYALTLLGCLAALMMPVPYIFYRYGAAIRKKSRSAINFD